MNKLGFNPYIQYFVFNIIILFLYIIKLSRLYNPQIDFIIYYFSILLFFLLCSVKEIFKQSVYEKKIECYFNLKSKKLFINVIYLLFIIGFLANIWQVMNYGMPFLEENKLGRNKEGHYIQYLVNFLLMSSSMSYIAIRENFQSMKKMIIIFILSNINLFVWLNRGAFTLQLITILIYEYIKAKEKRKIKIFVCKFCFFSIIFIMVFSYVGNIRSEYVLESIFKYTINEHYKMDAVYPTWFVWIYIYITSPLENMNRILEEQVPHQHTLGMRMIYPFVAPLFKLTFDSPTNLKPSLEYEAGLNVSTYMVDAITDFGMIGPYIYMIYLIFILRLGQISLKKGIYGMLTYASAMNIALWLSFANAFAIGPFMIAFLFFLFMAWIRDIKF